MATDAAARGAIETWFLAQEADLADLSYEGEELSPEKLVSFETTLREAGIIAEDLIARGAPVEEPASRRLVDAAAPLLGQVAGACFGKNPTLRVLRAAERLVRSRAGWAAFSTGAASEVGSSGLKLGALVRCLEKLVHAFTWAPRRAVRAHRDNMCVLVEQYRRQPRVDDLWCSLDYTTILLRHVPAFDALRLSDPASFLRLLDQFPHPEPGRHILAYVADCMVLNDLLGLLALAQPCFDAGNWLPWVKTPFLIVTAIETKLEMLTDAAEDGSFSPSDAFVVATRQAIQSVLGRVDGNSLGHAWLQRLIQWRSFGSRRRPVADRPPLGCRDQLLCALASMLSPRHDAVEWVMAEQGVFRRYRAVAAIATAGLGEAGSPSAAADLMGEVLRLDLLTTGQENSFSVPLSAERRLMAAVIGRHVAPATWFDDLWRGLVPLRDRARHAAVSADSHASDATVVAVSWLLFGLDTVDVRAPAHRDLWRSLHSAVREGAATQASLTAQTAWRMRYGFLTAYLGHRLVMLANEEAMSDLKDLLEPILCLEMTLAEVVATLVEAGVAPAVIAAGSGRPAFLVGLLRRLEIKQVWRETMLKDQLGAQSQFSRTIARAADMIHGAANARS